jgi:Mrp family chromosome partitioning ATPase
VLGRDGVTEVAANLAKALGKLGRSTLLADFDTDNPSIAQRLGVPIVPNLAGQIQPPADHLVVGFGARVFVGLFCCPLALRGHESVELVVGTKDPNPR